MPWTWESEQRANLSSQVTRPVSVAIYARISSDRAGEGLGVMRQEEDCRALAKRLGLPAHEAEVFVDNDIGASTRSRKPRPRFEELMRRAEAGEVTHILAYSSSRLTRRPIEYERIIQLVEKHDVALHTVVSGSHDLTTADGRGVARTLAAWDAAESERTGERISRAAIQRAEQGQWHGGSRPPFGYELTHTPDDRGKTLRPHPQHAPMLREAATRILSGESLYGICADWNRQGLTTGCGVHWRSKTLRSALLNPGTLGMTVIKRPGEIPSLYPAHWDSIIDRATWERVYDILMDPSRRVQPKTGYGVKHALGGGLTVCDVCGKRLISQQHRGKSRLICHGQATGGCGTVTVNYAHLEEFVLPLVWDVLDTDEMRAALQRPTDDTDEDVRLRDELREIGRLKDQNYNAFQDGLVDKDRYLRRERELDDRRDHVQGQLVRVMSRVVVSAVPSLDVARERWERGDVPWRRGFLSALIKEVRVARHPQGVASTLTRFSKRGESDEEFAERVREHRARIMRERVEIDWRA